MIIIVKLEYTEIIKKMNILKCLVETDINLLIVSNSNNKAITITKKIHIHHHNKQLVLQISQVITLQTINHIIQIINLNQKCLILLNYCKVL